MSIIDRGLDLSVPEHTTAAEAQAFRDVYTGKHGAPIPAYDFWLDNDPEMLKRHRLQASRTGQERPWFPLLYLHYYVVIGYEDGIAYEYRNAVRNGYTKEHILETIAVAFLHCGPFGIRYADSACGALLRDFEQQPATGPLFPAEWEPNAAAFATGLDFTNPELSAVEQERLNRWYADTLGEIPPYVQFLGREQPALLKAWRGRFENTLRTLPKQLMPFYLLHLHVSRVNPEGMREALLLARAFGVSKELVLNSIGWGMLYGGPSSVSTLVRHCGDILETFPDE
jgi:hypothetical protein